MTEDAKLKLLDSRHIVFVTGCFVSHRCWDEWKNYFEARGYKCYAPAWPNKDAPAAELRARHPDAAIASNRLCDIVGHYERLIGSLPEKPIVIGHSFGGLITQILVNRDLAAAGIAIHSVPPGGVPIFEPSVIRSIWRALGYFTSTRRSYLMSFRTWQFAFTNGMDLEDQERSYAENVVPESKLLARDGLGADARIDFAKHHAPLLMISGGADRIMPASLNLRNFRSYAESGSILEYRMFPGRNHFVLGLPTWRREADFAADWLDCLKQN